MTLSLPKIQPPAEFNLTASLNELMKEVTIPYIEPPPPGEQEDLIILEE